MKLLAFIVPGLVSMSAAQPQTFVSFSADSKRTLSGTGINIGNIGKIKVDNQLKRIRTDISEISIEVGGMPTPPGGVSLPQLPPTVLKISGTELLRYDMKKNFSWAADPQSGTVVCECADLESPMPQFAVDAQAVAAGQETIKSNDVDVVTDKWTSGLTMQSDGAGVSNTLTYNVEGTKLRRMEMKAKVSGGGFPGVPGISLETSFAFDFWNVKEMTESVSKANWYDPHPSCLCASPPVLPIANSYPTVLPTTTCKAFGGCACLTLNSGIPEDLAFCKNEVKWQISETLFPAQTDAFVQQAYNSWKSVFNPTGQDCLNAYKTWLCKFYFQICAEGGALLIPPAFGACAGVTFSTAETTGYQQVANLAAGKTAGGMTSSASTTSAISLALALPVAVALL